MQTNQTLEEFWLEISSVTRPGIVHQVLHELVHLMVLKQPLRQWDAKSVLLLVKHFCRQGILHRLLENVPLLKAFKLERGGYSAR